MLRYAGLMKNDFADGEGVALLWFAHYRYAWPQGAGIDEHLFAEDFAQGLLYELEESPCDGERGQVHSHQ